MAVYLREQWGSTGELGGYDLSGPVSEAYVHHFGSGIQPARSVDEAMARMRSAQAYHRSLGWLPVAPTGEAAPVRESASHLNVQVVAAEWVAERAVCAEQLIVDVASPAVDVVRLGDGFKMVRSEAARVATKMVDDIAIRDGRDEQLVGQPIDHDVRSAALALDHAVPGFGRLACPVPAASDRVDNGALAQPFGEISYAEHRNTPLQWSHAPGRPTGAGALPSHCTLTGSDMEAA